MAKVEVKPESSASVNPMVQLLTDIAAAVDDLNAKRKTADASQLQADRDNTALAAATSHLQELRTRMHEALGGTLNEVGRVRQTN